MLVHLCDRSEYLAKLESIFATSLVEVHDSLLSCSECETAYLVYSSPVIYVSSSQASLLSAVAN
jgi:hypothetical protein